MNIETLETLTACSLGVSSLGILGGIIFTRLETTPKTVLFGTVSGIAFVAGAMGWVAGMSMHFLGFKKQPRSTYEKQVSDKKNNSNLSFFGVTVNQQKLVREQQNKYKEGICQSTEKSEKKESIFLCVAPKIARGSSAFYTPFSIEEKSKTKCSVFEVKPAQTISFISSLPNYYLVRS